MKMVIFFLNLDKTKHTYCKEPDSDVTPKKHMLLCTYYPEVLVTLRLVYQTIKIYKYIINFIKKSVQQHTSFKLAFNCIII